MTATETLTCEVIAWRDEPRASSGWHIITVRGLRGPDDDRHTVTGCNLPRPGSHCVLRGEWQQTRYGEQFWAQAVESVRPPLSAAGVARWLEDRCDGIGPVKAAAILTHFGDQPERLWAALDTGPGALSDVPGLTPELSAHVHEAYQADGESRQHYATLRGWRLTQAQITRIVKHWPVAEACERLHADPYLLCEHISGFGFKRADEGARAIGVTKHDRVRLRAAVLHCLHEAAQQGHVYGDLAMFEEMSRSFLEVSIEETTGIIVELRDANRLTVVDESRVYLPVFEQAEREAADATVSALDYDAASDVSYAEQAKREAADGGWTLHPEQIAAINLVADMSRPIGFITGGPGTGKTTILGHAVRALEAQGITTLLAAPTGKAAKRLSEATGRPAITLHRLLQFRPEHVVDCQTCQLSGGGFTPVALDRVALIVDEASMVDLQLWAAVQRAINRGDNQAVVRYVGDADQLPPVGPGQPFQDHLRALADQSIVVRLRAVMRQGKGSWVAESAPLVLRGAQPDLAPRPDFRFIEVQRADHVPATLEALYSGEHDATDGSWTAATLAADYVPARNWPTGVCAPVLVPQHKGVAGTAVINRVLSEHFQPPLADGFEAEEVVRIPLEDGTTLRQGARVMCLKNDYQKGVRNGDTGVIEAMLLERDRRGEPRPVVMVRLDPDETTAREIAAARATPGAEIPDTPLVRYEQRDAREQLCLSYAMSIHKSQGSQYPWIIVVCHSTHSRMLTRRLLYTAITRASEGVVLVGNREGFMRAVQNAQETRRNTWLQQRLTAALGLEVQL